MGDLASHSLSNKWTLGIETSCDDTSVALVNQEGEVKSCLAANQDLHHRPFGGVVPEIASRNHTLQLLPLIEELRKKTNFSWQDIDGIAVTSRPGLIGSLLVGVITAKTLALAHNLKLIGINHLEAHILAPFLYDNEYAKPLGLKFPYLALAISGGHTQLYWVKGVGQYQVLGRTVDDAAGEAIDKFAKYLGLGFPGGVAIDKASKFGNPKAFKFPRTMSGDEGLDYSFSGLKSAAIRVAEKMSEQERSDRLSDLAASYQEAVVDSLMIKLDKAADIFNAEQVVLTGGVSANTRLREVAEQWAGAKGRKLFVPPIRYCTDNAAMVAYAGSKRLAMGEEDGQDLSPLAASAAKDFQESSR